MGASEALEEAAVGRPTEETVVGRAPIGTGCVASAVGAGEMGWASGPMDLVEGCTSSGHEVKERPKACHTTDHRRAGGASKHQSRNHNLTPKKRRTRP